MIGAIVQALHSAKIQYVVIGGIAASIWGRPRMTLGVDIVMMIPPEKLPDFLEILGQSGFQIASTTMRKLLRMLPAKVRYEKRLSVDLRLASYSLDKQALLRAVPVRILGTRLLIASREDTIAYKVARFDDLDKADIKAIILRWRKKLDSEYIIKTCQKLAEEARDEQIFRNLDIVLSWL